MKILKAADSFYKALKGKINFETVETYVKTQGYKIIFFNSPQGDAEITRYCLSEKAEKKDAFTYTGNAKIVFINSECSAEEKFYLLLHEAGHIYLKHVNIERTYVYNKVLLDIKTDTFVWHVLNRQRSYIPLILCFLISVFVLLGAYIQYCSYKTESTAVVPSVSETVTYQMNSDSSYNFSELVLITRTGTRFHSESCSTVSGKSTAHIERAEAEKLFTPCKTCNP